MRGFRVALGGAQALYGVTRDLTTLGKVIGGGMPGGALGGRAEVMDYLAPEGAVYQAGTLSGNPLAMAAGLATLSEVAQPGFYDALEHQGKRLTEGLAALGRDYQHPLATTVRGGLFGFCFNDNPKPRGYQDMAASDAPLFKQFYQGMLAQGVYFALLV